MKISEFDENSEDKIKLLNKILQKLKEEKIKSEKNEILYKKRYKVFSMDKEKLNIKKANEIKSLIKKKYIRACISNDKDKLIQKKLNDEQKLEEQKIKNFFLKFNINKSLEWRKQNFSGLIKKKTDRIKQEKIIRMNNLIEIKEKNIKNIALKTQLKKKIEDEIEALQKLEPFTKNEEEINKILKLYPNLNEINDNDVKSV